jgi:hypothetical protein
MPVNPTLFARAVYWALIAAAPALLAAASGRTYLEVCGVAEGLLLGLSALAVLIGAGFGPSLSRQLMLPALLTLTTIGVSLQATSAIALGRESLGAFCLSAALGSLGTRYLLGDPGGYRFTGRVVAVTAFGALGLVALLPLGLGRDPGTTFAAGIGAASIGSLILGAAKFEAVLAEQEFPEVRARATSVLLGTALGMVALAAASLGAAVLAQRAGMNAAPSSTAWLSARDAARASWSSSLPIAAAVLSLFVGRGRGTGLVVQQGRDFGWMIVAVALPATLFASLLLRSEGRAGPPRALAATTSAVKPMASPKTPPPLAPPLDSSAGEPPPAASAESPPDATAPAEPAPAAAPALNDDASGISVEVSSADGVYEDVARRSILRRIERVHECTRRDPGAHGVLSARMVVDADGSVTNVVPLSGDLIGGDFAKCVMLWLYRVGFAPHNRETAKFEVTLHFPGGGG